MNSKLKFLLPVIFLGLISAGSASAHNPRIISGEKIIQVKDPEISQAFYGQLDGYYQEFKIISNKPFDLYTNILVPDLPLVKTDMSVEVFRLVPATTSLAVLEAGISKWKQFYEPFAGDSYWQGPEFKQSVPAGQYLIRVFNQSYKGKYVLAVGEIESFSLGEIFNTIFLLPRLKQSFFSRSPLTAYFNYTGVFLLAGLLIIALGIFLVWRKIKSRHSGEPQSLPKEPDR